MTRSAPLALVLCAACGSEYQLQPPAPGEPVTPPPPKRVALAVDDGSAVTAEEDPVTHVRVETFDLGDTVATPVADYLFVVDNSVSMLGVIGHVQQGFAGLAHDAFPPQSRVAVMSTLPGQPPAYEQPHPAAGDEDWILYDPGFLRLVDRAGIERFRARAPKDLAARYPADGCDDAWFRPRELDRNGVPCLVAHTQVAYGAVGVEAGLVAFKQLLISQKSPFREGAAANVVFVSDTHDPGMGDSPARDLMVSVRPTFEELERMLEAQADLASFRVHAIAPKSACVEAEPWQDDTSYFTVAEASGGAVIDVCTETDWSGVLGDVASRGARMQRPTVRLSKPATKVLSATLDGAPVAWKLGATKRALTLDGPLGSRGTLVVTYQ